MVWVIEVCFVIKAERELNYLSETKEMERCKWKRFKQKEKGSLYPVGDNLMSEKAVI